MSPEILRRARRRGLLGQAGVAGLEAALIMPLVLFFILGTMELYNYFRTYAIMERAAFAVADGISMQFELFGTPPCDLSNHLCTYGKILPDLMRPVDFAAGGSLTVRVYATEEQSSGWGSNATTKTVWKSQPEWGRRCNGQGVCTNLGSSTRPAALPAPNKKDTIVAVDVVQSFEPFVIGGRFWQALGGERTLTVSSYYRPRFDDLSTLLN